MGKCLSIALHGVFLYISLEISSFGLVDREHLVDMLQNTMSILLTSIIDESKPGQRKNSLYLIMAGENF